MGEGGRVGPGALGGPWGALGRGLGGLGVGGGWLDPWSLLALLITVVTFCTFCTMDPHLYGHDALFGMSWGCSHLEPASSAARFAFNASLMSQKIVCLAH